MVARTFARASAPARRRAEFVFRGRGDPARTTGRGGGYCPDGTWCPDGHHCLCHGVAADGTVGQGGYCECEPDELTYGEPSDRLGGMARRRFSLSARARQRAAYARPRGYARATSPQRGRWDPFECPGQLNCGKDASGQTICCDDCDAPLCGLALQGRPSGAAAQRSLGYSAGATGVTRAVVRPEMAAFAGATRRRRPRRWCPPGTAPIPSPDGTMIWCVEDPGPFETITF